MWAKLAIVLFSFGILAFLWDSHQGFIYLLAVFVVCLGVIVLSHILFSLRWPFGFSGSNQRASSVVFYDGEKHHVVQESQNPTLNCSLLVFDFENKLYFPITGIAVKTHGHLTGRWHFLNLEGGRVICGQY